ncbi:MAG: ATP-binding protein [Actinomycetota bacterium]|nr:ATP-binding protein [Actinomycetota bacterium]
MHTFILILLLIVGIAIGFAISLYWSNRLRPFKVRDNLESSSSEKPSSIGIFRTLTRNDGSGEEEHGPRAFSGDLRSDMALLIQALDSIPQGITICSADGEVLIRNKVASSIFEGRHQDALAARAFDELLTLAKAGTMTERSLEIYGPPKRSYLIRTDALESGGKTIGVIAILEDISDKKHLDEVRRDFVANVSHELKTPIGAMGLLAETLTTEEDLEIAKRLSIRIQNEAFRLGRIIDDLLDLSRIESEDTPTSELVDIEKMVAETVTRIGPSAEVRHVTIQESHAEAPAYVRGDARELMSAVYNLLDNAVKYSESGSTVSAEIVNGTSTVDIRIIDQGIGIPSRDLERIFERFYRVDQARSRATGGTGLGLSIVRHVANNHNGNVFVESREGSGSVFTLRLPLAESGET